MLTANDLQQIKGLLKEQKIEIKEELAIELKPLKKSIKKIQNDLDVVIRTFDSDINRNTKRITRIENTLNLPAFEDNLS